jgi:hypothetical protein
MLVATVSHFLELKSELELLRSRCNADLTEDEVDAPGPGCAWPRTDSYRMFLPWLLMAHLTALE